MNDEKNKQNEAKNKSIAEIARKKRQLFLYNKLHSGKPLSTSEIKEIEAFEGSPLLPGVVRSQKEVAQALGVDKRTVERWAAQGMPVTPEGNYDLLDIKAWHMTRRSCKNLGETEKDKWDIEYRKNRALLIKLEYEKTVGELLPKEEVEKGRIARILAVKRSFLALPTRVAPVLAMREPREIEALLYEAIAEIIDEFAR
jgi:DNA-binding transcriptional regulator YiaG